MCLGQLKIDIRCIFCLVAAICCLTLLSGCNVVPKYDVYYVPFGVKYYSELNIKTIEECRICFKLRKISSENIEKIFKLTETRKFTKNSASAEGIRIKFVDVLTNKSVVISSTRRVFRDYSEEYSIPDDLLNSIYRDIIRFIVKSPPPHFFQKMYSEGGLERFLVQDLLRTSEFQ